MINYIGKMVHMLTKKSSAIIILQILFYFTLSPLYVQASLPDPLTVDITQIEVQNFPDIVFYATVVDATGDFVSDISADVIEVYEDDVLQDNLSIQSLSGTEDGVSICLIVDESGSMSGSETQVKESANGLLTQIKTNDRAAVVFFSDSIDIEQEFVGKTIDTDEDGSTDLQEAISNYLPNTGVIGTRLYEGINQGLAELNEEGGIKAIVVLADGDDNSEDISGDADKEDIILEAQRQNIPVYTIGLGYLLDSTILQEISTLTGGTYYEAADASDIEAMYNQIYDRLNNLYRIGYSTPDNDPTITETREIKFAVKNNETPYPSDIMEYIINPPGYIPDIVLTDPTIALSAPDYRHSQDTTIDIAAYITDEDSSYDSIAVVIFYRNVDGENSFSQSLMAYNSTTAPNEYLFDGVIPGNVVKPWGMEYYILAADGEYAVTSPAHGTTSVQTYQITIEPNYPAEFLNFNPDPSSDPPPAVSIGDSISFTFDISDDTYAVASARLFYRVTGQFLYNQKQINLSGADPTYYTVTSIIPASAITTTGVEYYFSATDDKGLRSDKNSPTSPYTLNIRPFIEHTPSEFVVQDVSLDVDMSVIDTTVNVDSVRVYYRDLGSSNAYNYRSASNTSGNSYRVTLDTSTDIGAEGVEYYIRAEDNYGEITYDGTADTPYSIPMNPPPTITHTEITYATVNNPAVISATVTDEDDYVGLVRIRYRTRDIGSWNYITMDDMGSNIYTGEIPANAVTASNIDYCIEAQDNYGATSTRGSSGLIAGDSCTPYQPLLNYGPTEPVLIAPKDGATRIGGRIYLNWEPSTDPSGDTITYSVNYCTDSSFSGCNPRSASWTLNEWLFSSGQTVQLAGGLVFVIAFVLVTISGLRRQFKMIRLFVIACILTGILSCGTMGLDEEAELLDCPPSIYNPTEPVSGLYALIYNLKAETVYYWKVIATDDKGGYIDSEVHRFTTDFKDVCNHLQ